jgi:hypothetical protein
VVFKTRNGTVISLMVGAIILLAFVGVLVIGGFLIALAVRLLAYL